MPLQQDQFTAQIRLKTAEALATTLKNGQEKASFEPARTYRRLHLVECISERVFKYKLKTAEPFIQALIRLFVANLRASTPDGALRRPPSES